MNFAYTYDNRSNIVSETRNGVTTTYEYDELGQLVRVNDPNDPAADSVRGTTWVYSYDRGGNILQKLAYVLSSDAQPSELRQSLIYEYTDANWKDKLTLFCNDELEYDAIGNLTDDGQWTYTWEKGRQLKSMHNANSGVTMEFKYNHEGIRTQKVKKVNGIVTETTDYILKGKTVAAMKKNTDTYYFTYDASGNPATVNFNGANYTYIKNLQNDIVGILDASGDLVVEYKYDAWGDAVSIYSASTIVDSLAFDNPFRYRGYVWDEETGLYYLRSRYYNPKCGRFINADVLLSNKKRLLTTNIYVYCGNSPIIYNDPNGKSFLGVLMAAMLVGLAATLSGCSDSNSVKDAPDLDREKNSRFDYNCYGNAIGKQIRLDPKGYEYGMTPEEVYELIKREVGAENIEMHDSIEAEVGADEYMVALNCGIDDYHFIVYDNGVIYNKQGNLDLVDGCTLDCINSQEWYTHFHTNEQLAIYGTVVESQGVCYDEGPIFFSINRNWSN